MERFTPEEYKKITDWLIEENGRLDKQIKDWANGDLVALDNLLAQHVARRENLAKISQVVTGNKPIPIV